MRQAVHTLVLLSTRATLSALRSATRAEAAPLRPPPIHQWPIPYGAARKRQMAAYAAPLHRERVPAFAHQTHSDWNSADMHVYRTRLARLSCPAGSLAPSN